MQALSILRTLGQALGALASEHAFALGILALLAPFAYCAAQLFARFA